MAGAGALVALAVSSVGCGRSFRVIHRGDVHFERCYGSDFDERIPAEYKLGCWASWLRHYTFGQPLHRIRYAESRVAAITAGLPGPHLPSAPVLTIVAPAYAADTAEPATDAAAQPAPGAAQAPVPDITIPPRTDSTAAAEASTRPTDGPAPSAPAESRCAAICRTDWNACVPACTQPETRDVCRSGCDDELRTCMRACR